MTTSGPLMRLMLAAAGCSLNDFAVNDSRTLMMLDGEGLNVSDVALP